jgi:Zn-finger nucleic acid-binding protein
MEPHRCPRDANALSEVDMLGRAVFSCAKCSGMWIGGQHVASLFADLGIAQAVAHGPAAPHALRCPVDGSGLRLSLQKGVQVDVCPTCHGLWSDGGELKRLARRPDAPSEVRRVGPSVRAAKTDEVRQRWYFRKPALLALILAFTLPFALPNLMEPPIVPASDPELDRLQQAQAAAAGCDVKKFSSDEVPRICRRVELRRHLEADMQHWAKRQQQGAWAWLGVGMACGGLVATGMLTAAIWVCAGGFVLAAKFKHYTSGGKTWQNLVDMRQPVDR